MTGTTSEKARTGVVRRAARIVGRDKLRAWVWVLFLAMTAAIVEALTALVVFVLFQLLDDPSQLAIPGPLEAVGLTPELVTDSSATFLVACGAFFVVRGMLLLLQRHVQARFDHGVGRDTAVRMFERYMTMPYREHLDRNSAELVRTSFWSTNEFVVNLLTPATTLLSETFIVLGLLAVLLVTSPVGVGITVLIVGPVVALVLLLIQPRLKRLGADGEWATGTALRYLSQSFEGVRDITVLQKEPFFRQRFLRARARVETSRAWLATLSMLPRLALETVVFVAVTVLLGISLAGSSVSDPRPLATIGLFGYAAVRLLPSVNRISAASTRIRFGGAAVDNIYNDLFDERLHSRAGDDPHKPEIRLRDAIELSDVAFNYSSGKSAVRGLDIRIEAGQFIGIVGPTGAGKTTLMDLMIGLLEPTSGSVKVDGVDIHRNLPGWWSHLGLVPQNVFLIDATLRENIALGTRAHEVDEDAVRAAVEASQLDELIESLPDGLDTVVGERGVRLSGGQRQRVAIARALYRRPDVLLFDEGTAALDTLTERALLDALDRLKGKYTMISIAHRLASVEACDRILLVDNGEIVDQGDYGELRRRNPMFDRMAG